MRLSDNATVYTARHLLKVAFPNHTPSLFVENQTITANVDGVVLSFFRMREDDADRLLTGGLPLKTVETPLGISVPLYLDSKHGELYTVEEGNVQIHCDLLTLSFVLLSRWEEQQPAARHDEHGRFLYAGSLQQRYDIADIPIIDAYALLLRHWVCAAFPAMHVTPRAAQCVSTHDVDILARFGSRYKSWRTLAADLLKYRSVRLFRQSKAQYKAARRNPLADPYVEACHLLTEHDQRQGWQSLFFVKAQVPGEYDCTYDITASDTRNFVQQLTRCGATIALHGSYRSAEDADRFIQEKARLENAVGQPITANRQHYLRFLAPQTAEFWQTAAIADDYTLGFAEREGFRCGTCHPYPLYDLRNDAPTAIIEHPLIAMDMTFIRYRQNDTAQTLKKIRQLKALCDSAEGDFVLLWHNTTVWREYEAWFHDVFCKL